MAGFEEETSPWSLPSPMPWPSPPPSPLVSPSSATATRASDALPLPTLNADFPLEATRASPQTVRERHPGQHLSQVFKMLHPLLAFEEGTSNHDASVEESMVKEQSGSRGKQCDATALEEESSKLVSPCSGADMINQTCSPNSNNNNNVEVPKIGMKFDCDSSAYEFYKEYAHRTGFSVRKQFIKRGKMGQIKRRTFVCSKEGKRGVDKRQEQVSFHHPISRVGCLARMTCQLQKDGLLEVVSFHEQHNHEFASSPMKHMLRSKRKISLAQKAIGDDAEKSRISIKQTIDLLSMQAGGRENLGFLDIDYKNYVQIKRQMALKKGDGRAVMEYFHKMQLKDPSFFYAIQLDDDDLIMNIFWVDARSIVDYGYFGDVICFDTTYRTNTYDRPFAPFVGVNHHKQTIIFGAALLYDETVDSFKWLFDTFLSAMSGKQPKTILTDQSAAMARAILEVFPESNHRSCVWHIYQNAAKHLSQVFHSSKEFTDDFSHCIYDYEDEDDWLLAWNNMLQKYSLTDNKWLAGIFEVKEKWAMVYGRHMFTADMKSTQRSESLNNVLKKYLKPKHDILRFLGHYSRVLADRRHQELQAEFKMRQTMPVLQIDVEMLRYVAGLYTPVMFQMFQDEYMKIGDCSIYKVSKSDAVTEYSVKYRQQSQEHTVTYEASTVNVKCNCMKFNFIGIICTHALKVLEKKNIKRLPSQYLLQRWTQDAKVGSINDHCGINITGDVQQLVGKRYSHLSHNFREISTFAAESEMMYEHAKRYSEILMKDFQEMRKGYYYDNMNSCNLVQGESVHRNVVQGHIGFESHEDVTFQGIGRIKTKPTVGRPRKRLKNALELRKNKKSQRKIVQQKANKSGKAMQVQSVDRLNEGFDHEPELTAIGILERSEQHMVNSDKNGGTTVLELVMDTAKKVSLPDVGVVGGLSDGFDERGKGPAQ